MRGQVLDLIPLETVLFPYEQSGLRVTHPHLRSLIRSSLWWNRPLGVAMIKEGDLYGAPPITFEVGTLIFIQNYHLYNRYYTLHIEGRRRFQIRRLVQEQPHLRVEVEYLDSGERPYFPGNYRKLYQILDRIMLKLELGKEKSQKKKLYLSPNHEDLLGTAGMLLSGFREKKQELLESPGEKLVSSLTEVFPHYFHLEEKE